MRMIVMFKGQVKIVLLGKWRFWPVDENIVKKLFHGGRACCKGRLVSFLTFRALAFFDPFIPGEIQCEDLVVLLSERAAREIYIKWTDTLMVHIHASLLNGTLYL